MLGPGSGLSNPQQQYSQFVIEVTRRFWVNPAEVSEILQSSNPLWKFEGTEMRSDLEQLQFEEILSREKFFESREQAELKRRIVEDLDF
jgi:hypothetical protein